METEGVFAPETREAVRERYAALGPAASETVRAVTRAMNFDGEEYDDRVTGDVREAAQDAMFASLLAVRVGTREEYERWRESYEGDLHEAGSEHVDSAVWHDPPWADAAVAATFQDEREAAVATLRRQAFGHLYSEVVR
jgi:hypothetical protein